jgi:hypothetical protein
MITFVPLINQSAIWLFRASYISVIVSGTILLSYSLSDNPFEGLKNILFGFTMIGLMEYMIYKRKCNVSVKTIAPIASLFMLVAVFLFT